MSGPPCWPGNTAEFSLRRSNVITELQAPVVVPIWTDEFGLLEMQSANVSLLDATLAKKRFKIGSYAYFEQSGKTSTFRKITNIASNALTFEAASVPAFTAGATVYPCILGMRPKDGAAFVMQRLDETDEMINIEEL